MDLKPCGFVQMPPLVHQTSLFLSVKNAKKLDRRRSALAPFEQVLNWNLVKRPAPRLYFVKSPF